MKFEKEVADFVEMRIEGLSFDEIAKKMGIAKHTLINWNKKAEIRNLINDGKAFALNSVFRAFQHDKKTRLKTMLNLSKKINAELLKRDLSSVDTFKLFQMAIANEDRITKTAQVKVQIGENENIVPLASVGDGFFDFDLDE